MHLPFFKKPITAPSREYFFALEIDHHAVKSAVWTVANSKTQMVSTGNVVAWDDRSIDSLIEACDQTLSDSANRLDPSGKTQPEKVILGLPSDWMGEDKIISDRLKYLKAMTQKLSLNAVGFVVNPEAAVRYIQSIDGAPPTAIIIGVWDHHLEITLVRLGKIDSTELISRSSKVVDDVVEGLSRFPQINMLPSRILLYDSGHSLEEIKQQLLAHPWQAPQTKLPFLHFPKIESLPSDFSIRAISVSGGVEVARSLGIIADEPTSVPTPEPNTEPTPEELGFSTVDVPSHPEPPALEQDDSINEEPPRVPKNHFKFQFPKLPSFPTLPMIRLPYAPLLFIIALVIASIGLLLAYWLLPRASVTLIVNSQELSADFNLTADTQISSPDLSKPSLPAQIVEVSVSAEKSTTVTGSKLVGDKATGTVTVINGTSQPRTFLAGSVLSSPSGLKFTTDSDISVASASGTADPNSYQPGKASVKVTASSIGSDSNLSAGTQFRVGTFASLDYVAKNDSALSGGSSRQVKAVSKSDLEKLRSDLTTSLKDQAKSELQSKVGSGQTLVSDSVTLQTTTENFDHKESEEADEVKLKLVISARGLVLTNADLAPIVSEQIRPKIPDGFSLTGDPKFSFTIKKVEKNTANLIVHSTAFVLPKYDIQKIITDISGKIPNIAEAYLIKLPAVSSTHFEFHPKLPDFLLTLPHQAKNIKLTITPAP